MEGGKQKDRKGVKEGGGEANTENIPTHIQASRHTGRQTYIFTGRRSYMQTNKPHHTGRHTFI